MSILKAVPLFLADAPLAGPARRVAAATLTAASAVLARLAVRLLASETRVDGAAAQLEFHAEAGPPEGALYFDGELVGHLRGVSRL